MPGRRGIYSHPVRPSNVIACALMILFGLSGNHIVSGQEQTIPDPNPASRDNQVAKPLIQDSNPPDRLPVVAVASESAVTSHRPAAPSGAEPDLADDLDSLLDADLQTLRDTRVSTPDMNMEVTTVSRTEVSVGRTPAAVFVITEEMIRRSGAYTLPDVLRMVPGLHVARSANGQWSVGVRGTAGIYADALLVQVDGRSIYTPAFGGVLWQVRDMPLSEIERIEVIRGPGASVWGANAVNGVINIVTKHTKDTLGTLVEGAAGDELRHQATVRQGGQSGPNKTWRVWGRRIEEDGGLLNTGADEIGTWYANQIGFRIDRPSEFFDENTITGGLTTTGLDNAAVRPSLTGPTFANPVQTEDDLQNWYLMSRRTRDLGDNESFEIQSFVDITEQDSFDLVDYRLLVADIGFQHHIQPQDNHDVIWGANYRLNYVDVNRESFQLDATADQVHYNLASLFVQDTITLREDLALTLGTKFSWNDLTDFEWQPTARMVWSPTNKCSLWTSVSRAVRLPAFLNTHVNFRTPPVSLVPLPTFAREMANPNLDAESLIAVEAGIRTQPTRDLFWDTSIYYFYSDDAIVSNLDGTTVLTNPPGFIDLLAPAVNRRNGIDSGGFESFMRYAVTDNWSVAGSYSLAMTATGNLDRYPENMAYLQSSHDFMCDRLQFDLIWRYNDLIRSSGVPAWNELDTRLSYRVSKNCEITLVGRNLLDSAHLEDAPIGTLQNQTSQVQRGIYGMVRLTY